MATVELGLQQRKLAQRRREWKLILTVLTTVLCIGANFKLVRISGDSMEPNYHDGQVVLAWRTASLFQSLRPGDVIVFYHAGETLIKRVAFAQDSAERQQMPASLPTPGGMVSVPALMEFDNHGEFPGYRENIASSKGGSVVDKTLFVMGDNTWDSVDSRDFGPVDPSRVFGTVIWPPTRAVDTLRRHGARHIWAQMESEVSGSRV